MKKISLFLLVTIASCQKSAAPKQTVSVELAATATVSQGSFSYNTTTTVISGKPTQVQFFGKISYQWFYGDSAMISQTSILNFPGQGSVNLGAVKPIPGFSDYQSPSLNVRNVKIDSAWATSTDQNVTYQLIY